MVATLVIQLPSLHEGGDLVVYRGDEVKYRHDFGKADNMAGYFPHYAVHYADAEHSLEMVTKGYRFVLVYSICLPANVRHEKRNPAHILSGELSAAIRSMGPEDDPFALLLAHQYTEKSIGELGCQALKGLDRARFQALEEANYIVPSDKKLQFYIAQLTHEIVYYGSDGCEMGGWEEYKGEPRKESITWYSTNGKRIGTRNWTLEEADKRGLNDSFAKLNFLNPAFETNYDLWNAFGSSKEGGFMGNEGPTKNTTYARYAIVAWPTTQDVANALKFMDASAVLLTLEKQNSVDAATLQKLLSQRPTSASTWFCQTLCGMLVEAGDAALVNLFFSNIFCRLGVPTEIAPAITSLVKAFEWKDIGESLLKSLGEFDTEMALAVALQVLDGLKDGPAHESLWKYVVENASQLENEPLSSSNFVDLLWKETIFCSDPSIVKTVADKFKSMDGSELGPAVQAFSTHFDSVERSDEKIGVLASIAAKRIDWLKNEIVRLDLPFTWKMPGAEFPDNDKIQEFLRGPDETITTKEILPFETLNKAKRHAAKWMREQQIEASFDTEAVKEEGTAFGTITKTKAWFSARQKELAVLKEELKVLTDRYEGIIAGSAQKRARVEK